MASPELAPQGVRAGAVLGGTREMVRMVYRDPEHLAERLTLYARDRLGEPAREWAVAVRQGDAPAAERAVEMCRESAAVARIDGAVAGTPFLIALVPGYVAYLWQEARMVLRLAALHGRDPRELRTSAEMLVLRGVHPTIEEAEAALVHVRDHPAPDRVDGRRPLRMWIRSVYRLLVFGGFLEAREDEPGSSHRVRAVIATLLAIVLWAITWVLPVTFMIAMAWSCESHTRKLARRALEHYGGDDPSAVTPRPRAGLRRFALFLSVALPIVFVAYVNHVRQTVGVNWLGALGALVALSLVLATGFRAARH